MQKWISNKLAKSSSSVLTIIKAAEIKISMSMVYFIIVGSMALVSVSVYELNSGTFRRSISDYLLCNLNGTCSLSSPDNLNSLGVASDVTTLMLACFPLVIFLLSINIQTCKRVTRAFKSVKKLKIKKNTTSNDANDFSLAVI